MTDIDLVIDVQGGESSDLADFLKSQGVRVRPHYDVFNGPMGDVTEMLKHPAPYIAVWATVEIMKTAIKAYADSKKKRFIVSRLKTGTKVDATNFSTDELRELGVLDVGKFVKDKNDT